GRNRTIVLGELSGGQGRAIDGHFVDQAVERACLRAPQRRADPHLVVVDHRRLIARPPHVPLPVDFLPVDVTADALALPECVGDRDVVPTRTFQEAGIRGPAVPVLFGLLVLGRAIVLIAEQKADGRRARAAVGYAAQPQGVVLILLRKTFVPRASLADDINLV